MCPLLFTLRRNLVRSGHSASAGFFIDPSVSFVSPVHIYKCKKCIGAKKAGKGATKHPENIRKLKKA